MRLQLMALVVLVAGFALGPAAAWAESGVSARVDSYDDGDFTVIAPSVRGVADPLEGVEVDASYTVDLVSGATPLLNADAVTSATRFSEERHEVRAGVRAEGGPTWQLGGNVGTSLEPDYRTHLIGVEGSVELLERMVTASAALQTTWERATSVVDERVDENSAAHSVDLAWVHALAAGTALHLKLSGALARCGRQLGCHASTYRYIAVLQDGAVRATISERHPDRRLRGAVGARLVQALGDSMAIHAGWREYHDDWGVGGRTLDASLAASLWADRATGRLEVRGSSQGAASFHRKSYTGPGFPQYRTADRELSALQGLMVTARARVTLSAVGPASRFGVGARVARLWYRYDSDDYDDRQAWLIGGGLDAVF